MSFAFRQQGAHAAIVHEGREILQFDGNINYFGGPFWVTLQVMEPGGEPEVAVLPVFAFYGYSDAVTEVRYEVEEGPDRLSVTLIPTNTMSGRAVLEQVLERCTFTVRLEEGRYVWEQRLEVHLLQDLEVTELRRESKLRVYKFPHQDGSPGRFWQFADPLPAGSSGPAVPMLRDWQQHPEPYNGPDTFRAHWRRRWDRILFQNPDESWSWSDLCKQKWFNLTLDNRRARPCHPQGYLYVLKPSGEALEYRCEAPSHYHHVCEWGMDFHFWADLAPFVEGQIVPQGTVLAAQTTCRLVGPEVTEALLAEAEEITLTPAELAKADRPAYEEPENSFAVSALERLDAWAWEPTSEGCRWMRTGAHHGEGGCLVIRNEYSAVGSWEMRMLGPQQWGNPFLPRARYRLSAWVKVEDCDCDTSESGPQVGVELVQSNGPAPLSSWETVDCGWSESLIKVDRPIPDRLEWTEVELITPPAPSNVLYGHLKLRFRGRGTAYFSNVRWEELPRE